MRLLSTSLIFRLINSLILNPPLAAARLHRVATSFKLTQYPIILFFPHHPFHNCKANKTYSFRIFEFIISTRCNFYSFELLYFPDLTRDAIARQRGFIRDQPTKTFNLQLRKPDITRGRPLLCLYWSKNPCFWSFSYLFLLSFCKKSTDFSILAISIIFSLLATNQQNRSLSP